MIDLSASRTIRALLVCALVTFGAVSHAQQVFRVTAIPDESPTELARKAAPLMKYLEAKLGMKVEFTPGHRLRRRGRDAGQQEGRHGLVRRLHLRAGQPSQRRQGDPDHPARRRRELQVRLHHHRPRHQDPGRPEGQGRELRLAEQHLGPPDAAQLPAAGGHRPRQGLQARRLQRRARRHRRRRRLGQGRMPARSTSRCGNKLVADKKVDTGKVRVFYTTPPYYDYNWTVHADLPAATREKLAAAFLALSKDTPEGKQILELQRASSSCRARPTTTRASRLPPAAPGCCKPRRATAT